LGVTGLADALLMVGLRYGSREAARQTEQWLHAIARAAYLASAQLAAEKGAFPMFEPEPFLASNMMQAMDHEVQEAVRTHGIRNALLTSIAPTGTISLLAGNVSSGIEPVFAYRYHRNLRQNDGTTTREEVTDYAVQMWHDLHADAPLPPQFIDAHSLTPSEHLLMQAAAQKWVDASISKTINCPEAIEFGAFKDIYQQAWDSGCKGCTTYRPNAVTGAILSGPEAAGAATTSHPMARPGALGGRTYKIKWPGSEHALYITINDITVAGQNRPFEIFVNSKNMEHFAWTVGLTRMISAVFRRGGDVSFVVEELKAVFDPRGGAWVEGKYIPSILAAIGGVIEQHMIAIGCLDGPGCGLKSDPQAAGFPVSCSNCGQQDVQMVENCMTCRSCGCSKCDG
jgi:ribonucleoside-diphosphate reductase alpha chain